MSEPYWTNCRNCGKQINLDGEDGLEEKCYWCGRPALKKEANTMLEKEEIKTTITPPGVISALPPVPLRPDLTRALNLRQRNMVMHAYYEDNAPAILAGRKSLGDKETRSRWGFSQCGYNNFLLRRGLTYEKGETSKHRSKKAAAQPETKAPSNVKETTVCFPPPQLLPEGVGSTPLSCVKCTIAAEYRGYQKAVKDMAGGI
jgi:hypothetical protein